MIESWDCAEAKVSLGVYVLGAIDPAERALVDAHVATCRDCRDELAGLAGIPALLARVGPEEIERIVADDPVRSADPPPPPALIDTVLDLAAARRRRAKWRYAAAAAAVVALGGGLFGGLAASSASTNVPAAIPFTPGEGSWDTASGSSSVGDVSATVAYSGERWGTVLAAKVTGIPVGTTCELWVVHYNGTRTESMQWTTADDEGRVWYWGSLSMPNTDKGVKSFEVTTGSKLLVDVPAS